MSVDAVGDREAAEDVISELTKALGDALTLMICPDANIDRVVRDDLTVALKAGLEYCRPTCSYGADMGFECDDDTCGCPCGHPDRENEDTADASDAGRFMHTALELAEYARHGDDCRAVGEFGRDPRCDCGLRSLLDGFDREMRLDV